MNHRIACMMLLAAVTVALAVPAFGQSGVVSATIPFDFIVADKTLPPGDYSFTCDLSHQLVNIESRKNDYRSATRLATLVEDKAGVTAPRLIFNQREGRYFLTQIWIGGSMGSQLMPSRIEVELAKHTNDTQVTVAGR